MILGSCGFGGDWVCKWKMAVEVHWWLPFEVSGRVVHGVFETGRTRRCDSRGNASFDWMVVDLGAVRGASDRRFSW